MTAGTFSLSARERERSLAPAVENYRNRAVTLVKVEGAEGGHETFADLCARFGLPEYPAGGHWPRRYRRHYRDIALIAFRPVGLPCDSIPLGPGVTLLNDTINPNRFRWCREFPRVEIRSRTKRLRRIEKTWGFGPPGVERHGPAISLLRSSWVQHARDCAELERLLGDQMAAAH
ncbi:MAG: hypothetical protein ACREEB_11425 [Caulobacteraceae bacterium]